MISVFLKIDEIPGVMTWGGAFLVLIGINAIEYGVKSDQ